MAYLILSIFCSVAVSVLLKTAKRYFIDIKQAITWNYAAATLLSFVFYKPQLRSLQIAPVPVYIYLAILLPAIFIFIAYSIRYTGIVRTTIAQRLSLIIPVVAAFLLFHETTSGMKMIGLTLGFVAISCSVSWQRQGYVKTGYQWLYPLIVFAGTGVIDILFNIIAQNKSVLFTTSLFFVFGLAFMFSLLYLAYLFFRKKTKFGWIHFICGLVLGIANFGSIVFYLKALHLEPARPSVIFSTLDIGVIAGGSIVGLFLFKEKLSILNKISILLAIVAIVLISFTK